MKAALYCRELLGPNGMAKATVLTAWALRQEGYDVEVLTQAAAPPRRLEAFFGRWARGLRVRRVGPPERETGRALAAATARYDLFINQSPGAYFPSMAPRSWLWVHAVPRSAPRHLSFYEVLGNSLYTQRRLKALWGGRVKALPPPVAVEDFPPRAKGKRILVVGTLGAKVRSKGELALVRLFRELSESGALPGWSLDVAGEPEGGAAWLARLKRAAAEAPVRLHADAGLKRLRSLYGRATLFWHACAEEHFGIALAEAMAAGCVVLAPKFGGPREIVVHGKSGWLYGSQDELRRRTLLAAGGGAPLAAMAARGRRESRRYGLGGFRERLRALIKAGPNS